MEGEGTLAPPSIVDPSSGGGCVGPSKLKLGYSRAAAVVAASGGKTPTQSQLLGGANWMAWAALVPSAACIATIFVMLLLTSAVAVFALAAKQRREAD